MALLALNAGSSSLKFGLFTQSPAGPEQLLRGVFDGIGGSPRFSAKHSSGQILADGRPVAARSTASLLEGLIEFLQPFLDGRPLELVGHRIVHGGSRFVTPIRLSTDVIAALDELTPIAPLHQPASLAPVRALAELQPGLVQIGCFDTAFHSSMRPPASRYALPRQLESDGVRRYGFHGLSYEYVSHHLGEISPRLLQQRTIVAHLGCGCSLCAMVDGKSQDTTMGFTALDGVMMATRCGSIDPGILLYLQKAQGLGVTEVEDLLYRRSGLLGVSGISGDMRALLSSSDPRATEAIDLFVFSISRAIAALASSIEGIELLVFTGGVGEHATEIRQAICRRLQWLGVKLDPSRDGDVISHPDSKVEVRVIATNEELSIARQMSKFQS
jgi:acetate kinase